MACGANHGRRVKREQGYDGWLVELTMAGGLRERAGL